MERPDGPAGGQRPAGDEDGLVAVPSFDGGGRVERTGIALVHEHEWIVPDAGSEALVEPFAGLGAVGAGDAAASADASVTYHFPIEVELVGELTEEQRRALADMVYEEIDAALQGQG